MGRAQSLVSFLYLQWRSSAIFNKICPVISYFLSPNSFPKLSRTEDNDE